MVRKDLLIHKTRDSWNEFLTPMLETVDKPRQRFLQQALRGILFSGSLVVTDLCGWIRDCPDRFYQVKRLLNHLVSAEADLTAAVHSYRQATSPLIEPDTALILDLTDLAKPRARKRRYVDLVHDGSADKLVMGYWCIEVYAYLTHADPPRSLMKRVIASYVKYRDAEGIVRCVPDYADKEATKQLETRLIREAEQTKPTGQGNRHRRLGGVDTKMDT